MMYKSKVPEIRFKGFSEEWEENELGNKVELFSGLTYSPNDVIKQNGTLVLRSSNVKNGMIVNADNVYVKSEVVNCDNVQKGDIAVVVRNGSRSLIGKHAQIQEVMGNTVIGAFMTGVRSNQPSFLNALLDSSKFNKEIEKNLGATINQITMGAFKKMIFSFPKEDEQCKIGNYFQKLDKLIEQKEKKYQKLKQFKKAMVDKMFPKNGADNPEIRFKGFSGKWEKKRLGDESEIVAGGDIDKNKILNLGKYPVIANALTFDGIVGYYSDSFRVKAPALTVTGRGDVGHAKARKMNFTPVVRLLTVKSNHDVDFLEQAINKHPTMVESTGVPQLTIPQLSKYEIYFPKIEEQEKIGNYFQKLDKQIDLQIKEIEKLKNIKKASLDKMFV